MKYFLTREEIEHPYANITVMLEDKRKKAEQMRKTVFAKITASPETLADKLVFYDNDTGGYMSTITNKGVNEWSGTYNSEAEAIAATVAKLKEVEK
jgi:hypothetical protein